MRDDENLRGFDLCEVLCGCVVDALAKRYDDEDLAALLASLDAGHQELNPELEEVGRNCALQASPFPGSGLELYSAAWYSEHLRAADEPHIEPTGREEVEVYRLLVLPSFEPTAVVRVERVGNRITFVTKRLSGAGGYEPGEIEWQAEGTVTDADWAEFKRLLTASDFWSQLSHGAITRLRMERCIREESGCWIRTDPTMWVLEGADRVRHHVVDRDALEPPVGERDRAVAVHLRKHRQVVRTSDVICLF